MYRKLAILAALLVAGALLSSVFAELATGRPASLPVAEEGALSLSDGSFHLFSGLEEGGHSGAAATLPTPFAERSLAGALAAASPAGRAQVVKQPLFLLFQAFLFYETA